jgi:uncharacterized protein YjcR
VTDKRRQAYEDYLNGMKYPDIAEKYGVTLSAVKSWASRYWKKKTVAAGKEKLQPGRTPNRQPEHRKGAAERNQNSVRHGAYRGFFADVLTDEERSIIDGTPPDLEQEYIEQLKILTIREKRLFVQIAKYQEDYKLDDDKISIMTSVTKTVSETGGEREKKLEKSTAAAWQYLKALEEQLTKIQVAKNKCIKSIAELQARKGVITEAANLVDEWVKGVLNDDS